jgi:hypothetical protein
MAFEEITLLLATGLNVTALGMLWYKLGKIEQKFKELPCYARKEFRSRKGCLK